MSNSCRHCAARSGKTYTVVYQGVEVGNDCFLCDACFSAAAARLAVWRVQFEALLAAGVSRGMANDIIIQRMNAAVGVS